MRRRLLDIARGSRRQRGGGLAATLVVVGACSLIIERNTDQCTTDADCKSFGDHSACSGGVCVNPTHQDGGAGCFQGSPTTDLEFYNQCTDAGCEPFDNCARLGLCGDAGLPELISPDAGGGG